MLFLMCYINNLDDNIMAIPEINVWGTYYFNSIEIRLNYKHDCTNAHHEVLDGLVEQLDLQLLYFFHTCQRKGQIIRQLYIDFRTGRTRHNHVDELPLAGLFTHHTIKCDLDGSHC